MAANLKVAAPGPSGGTRSSIETITPKMAKEWLAGAVRNRPLSQSTIIEYAILMDAGKWSVNGETIKFDAQGRLFDGQHRLQACVLAEKSFVSHVVRGVEDPDAFATVDVGKGRTHGDIFSLEGIADGGHASGVAYLLYLYKQNRITNNGPVRPRIKRGSAIAQKISQMPMPRADVDKETLLNFARPIKNEIAQSLSVAYSYGLKSKIAPVNTVAACYFLCAEKSKIEANIFFQRLGEGADLAQNDPILQLRERLIANAAESKWSGKRLTRWQIMAFILKAWNKARKGERVRVLRLVEGEDFPKVI